MPNREVKEVRIKFTEFLHDTGRAVLIDYQGKEIWLPKRACRDITVNKKMGGHLCLPVRLAEEKGMDIKFATATKTVVNHIPDKKEPIKTAPDESLTR